jgi:hypothetical protein
MTARNLRSAAVQGLVTFLTATGSVCVLITITLVVVFAAESVAELLENDQVVASFEREMNHEPSPAPAPTRSVIDDDLLYRTINPTQWSMAEDGSASTANNYIAKTDFPAAVFDLEVVTASSDSSINSAP